MENVSLWVAFVAGLFSFISPCILPLVPGYISFLSGSSLEELQDPSKEKKVVRHAGVASIFFVLGFSLVFMALGASASFVGKALAEHIGILTKVAGVIIILLGLHLTGILKIGWLYKQKHITVQTTKVGYLKAFLIGLAFAFGWSPCVGPILGGILALAATQDTLTRGILLLGAYSLGVGIPFIITGFAVGAFMKFFEKFRSFIKIGSIVAGVFLIAIGILIFTNNLELLLDFVPESFYKMAK